ncbi:MAG: isoprenylcysteine carboxylmethyltransferase family protein [Sedimentisphaerales bacterium]|nr:isoprenylcysteine carboxylmethyltransferase family protein [Sedimentisphaerales bacterium]
MSRLDTIFEVIFLVGFVIGSVIRKVYTTPSRRSKVVKKRKSTLDIILVGLSGVGMAMPLVYLLTPWLDVADYPLPRWLSWIGTVVFAGAIVLLWRSHVDLGRNWSPTLRIRPEHTLITHGVYRYIRHPMYAAHLLWAIGQGLLLANWLAGWILFVTFVPFYFYRKPKEEQLMLDRFGDGYRQYMKRTGGMIPRIWK